MRPLLLATLLFSFQDADAPAPDAARVEARLRAELTRLVDERGIPGASAAVVLPDGRTVAVAAGLAAREAGRALVPSDRLLSGSIGKTYVAAVTAELVERGELDLDARVATFFADDPWYERVPNAAAITVRQLTRHQSGIDRYELKPAFWRAALAEPDRTWEPAELVAFVLGDAPLFPAGDGFAYADTNYILLGMIVERVTDEPITARIRARFLEPHGLGDTVPSDSRRIPGLVQGYAVLSRDLGLPERVLGDDGRFVLNPQFEWCGGGYANTPSDLARWARILFSGDAFAGDYLTGMLAAVDAPELGRGKRYGLGVILTPTELGEMRGHDGFMTGYLAAMGWIPDAGMAVAFQTNTDDVRGLREPLSAILVRLVKIAREALAE